MKHFKPFDNFINEDMFPTHEAPKSITPEEIEEFCQKIIDEEFGVDTPEAHGVSVMFGIDKIVVHANDRKSAALYGNADDEKEVSAILITKLDNDLNLQYKVISLGKTGFELELHSR